MGGSAVVVLCKDAEATKDLDAFPSENLNRILKAVEHETSIPFVDIKPMSASFESYLPEKMLWNHLYPETPTNTEELLMR